MRDGFYPNWRFEGWRTNPRQLQPHATPMETLAAKPRKTRKARVARLVYMLATDQIVRATDLCRSFRVSKRTFARYIADVREAGFDVVYSEIEDTYRLNSVDSAASDN